MDQKLKEEVDRIITSSKLTFGETSYIYTFTNENIKGTLSLFDLYGKDILTVTGSGDHVLNCLLHVDSIDTFDINLFAYYFFVLKKYAINCLEVDEYINFLLNIDGKFDLKVWNKIKANWKDEIEIRDFFDYLFNRRDSYYLKRTPLFVNNSPEKKKLYLANNLYLDEDNYNKLKQDILDKQVQFFHSNLTNLKLSKKYDFMFFSNIVDYLNNMFSNNPIRSYKKFLYKNMIPHLNPNGKIVSYHYNGLTWGCLPGEIEEILKCGFSELEVENDKIRVYEKKVN